MTTSVYVAAASKEIARAERVHEALRAIPNVKVVSTWIEMMRGVSVPEHAMPPGERARNKQANADAIYQSSVVLFLAPPPGAPTRMGWWELGYVEGLIAEGPYKRRVLVSGPHARDSICTEGYEIHATDEEAIGAIAGMASRG